MAFAVKTFDDMSSYGRNTTAITLLMCDVLPSPAEETGSSNTSEQVLVRKHQRGVDSHGLFAGLQGPSPHDQPLVYCREETSCFCGVVAVHQVATAACKGVTLALKM